MATYVLHPTGCTQRTISYCVKDSSGAINVRRITSRPSISRAIRCAACLAL